MSDWRVACAEGFLNVLFLTKKMIPQAAGTKNKNGEKSPKSEDKFSENAKASQKGGSAEDVKKDLAESLFKILLCVFAFLEVMSSI